MKDALIVVLLITTAIVFIRSWSATFKIAYYETLIAAMRDSGGKTGTYYEDVKNDFWRFLK